MSDLGDFTDMPEKEDESEEEDEEKEVDPRNKLNELPGDEWLHFTRSLKETSYESILGHELRKEHTANKPPQICEEFINFFTKSNHTVLDPFAGVGGSLLGASLAGRDAIGIEIEEKWVNLYNEICHQEPVDQQRMIRGNAHSVLDDLIDEMGEESLEYIITDPPYYQTDTEGTSSDENEVIDGFSEGEGDIGLIEEKDQFYTELADILSKATKLLKPDKYVTVFMKNRYIDGKYHPLSHEMSVKIEEETDLTLRGEHVWFQQGQRMYPYGYPYAYVPNTVHQNIMVFRKDS
jgi:DNA modification methylase